METWSFMCEHLRGHKRSRTNNCNVRAVRVANEVRFKCVGVGVG